MKNVFAYQLMHKPCLLQVMRVSSCCTWFNFPQLSVGDDVELASNHATARCRRRKEPHAELPHTLSFPASEMYVGDHTRPVTSRALRNIPRQIK